MLSEGGATQMADESKGKKIAFLDLEAFNAEIVDRGAHGQ